MNCDGAFRLPESPLSDRPQQPAGRPLRDGDTLAAGSSPLQSPSGTSIPMYAYLNTIRQRSVHMFLTVARIMLPVMVVVYAADRLGWVHAAGVALTPVMSMLGLPPEAGIIWVTTAITNIYGGMATMAALSDGLHMNVAQVSALGLMMLFAHNVPTEQSVVRRAGASALFTGALRFGAALVGGTAVARGCQAMGWLQQPVSLGWMQQEASLTQGPQSIVAWLASTAESMGLILVIIIALVILLDVLERLKITPLITRLLTPVLRLSGLEERAAPLTTVGVLLGLAYGGALIIDAAGREGYSPRTRLLALSWLSLCHALIEDTLLLLALGASLWVILFVRVLVTLLVLAVLAALTRPHTRWGRRLARS